jgi:glycosyltransferase A (GT-A) superfamily protein (DUF2064 family)
MTAPHAQVAGDRGWVLGLLITRAPVAGQSKTRLAGVLGDEGAAGLARAMACDVWAGMHRVTGLAPVLCVRGDAAWMEPPAPPWAVWQQPVTGDLGTVLGWALREGLMQAPAALVLGGDCVAVTPEVLGRAVEVLATASGPAAVVVPAEDGGFALLGLTGWVEGLFDGVPWSTADTGGVMRQRLALCGYEATILPAARDVDEPADLVWLDGWLAASPAAAPATAAWLARDWMGPGHLRRDWMVGLGCSTGSKGDA